MPALTVAAVGGFVAGGGAYLLDRLALRMIQPPPKRIRRGPESLGYQCREFTVDSSGVSLSAWLLDPSEDQGKPAVMIAHGWGSSHVRMTRLAKPLLDSGHPVFLFDVRHHGRSHDAPFVTARHFRDDILATSLACKEMVGDRPLALIGHSMGGSTGILAVAEGAPVQGLVCMAAPADLWQVWARHFELRKLPGRFIVLVLRPFWSRRVGVPYRRLEPLKKVRELDLPLLILHGSEDISVPEEQAHLLAEASGAPAKIFPGLGHSDLLERAEVHQEVMRFLEGLSAG
jgi:pimeloyl-ACP methyl ester carboxylesterase